MRTLATSLALSTVLLGGLCVYLLLRPAGQPVQERDARLMQDRIDLLVADRERLRNEVTSVRRSSPCDSAPSTERPTIRADNVAGGPAEPMPGARGVPGTGAFERLTREQRTTMVRDRYGRLLYQELSLSDAEVDALLPVLVAQDEGPGGPSAHFGQRNTPKARERENEIAAVIGPEKASQFAEARSSLPARSEVRAMREQLERAGAPLNDAQNAVLSAAVKDLGLLNPPPPASDEAPQQSVERILAWRATRAKFLRERIAPLLTPRQLQRWDDIASLRAALRQAPGMPLPAQRLE